MDWLPLIIGWLIGTISGILAGVVTSDYNRKRETENQAKINLKIALSKFMNNWTIISSDIERLSKRSEKFIQQGGSKFIKNANEIRKVIFQTDKILDSNVIKKGNTIVDDILKLVDNYLTMDPLEVREEVPYKKLSDFLDDGNRIFDKCKELIENELVYITFLDGILK